MFEAKTVDSEVHISVTDSGRGIAGGELGAIWQVFYQVNREKFEDPGTGSGLAIVKGLADSHNARVDVQSQQGEGSCFTVILPQVI